MLPGATYFQKVASDLGITNEDKIVIYDNSDIFSACRCWFTFFYFGHNPKKLSVLDGGLKKWKLENRIFSKTVRPIKKSNYLANEQKDLVKNITEIEKNIIDQKFEVIDARSKKRFEGLEPEPRSNLRSGHIKNSKNFPFIECINKPNSTFKNKEDLIKTQKVFPTLTKKFKTMFPSEESYYYFDDKLKQYEFMVENDIPCLETHYVGNKEEIEKK